MHRCPRSILRAGVVAGLVVGGMLAAVPAVALSPTHGTAEVDGVVDEWTAADEVAPLVAVTPPHETRATLSLRYDCAAEVLYARVQVRSGAMLRTDDPAEAYLRLGPGRKRVSGVNGGAGFAWVNRDGDAAEGIEMSTPVPPGEYGSALRVHAKVFDASADGYETVDLAARADDLSVACGDPAARAVGAGGAGDPADPPDPGSAVAGGELVRTGLTNGAGLLAVSGVLILAGLVALRLRQRLASG